MVQTSIPASLLLACYRTAIEQILAALDLTRVLERLDVHLDESLAEVTQSIVDGIGALRASGKTGVGSEPTETKSSPARGIGVREVVRRAVESGVDSCRYDDRLQARVLTVHGEAAPGSVRHTAAAIADCVAAQLVVGKDRVREAVADVVCKYNFGRHSAYELCSNPRDVAVAIADLVADRLVDQIFAPPASSTTQSTKSDGAAGTGSEVAPHLTREAVRLIAQEVLMPHADQTIRDADWALLSLTIANRVVEQIASSTASSTAQSDQPDGSVASVQLSDEERAQLTNITADGSWLDCPDAYRAIRRLLGDPHEEGGRRP